MKRVVALGLMVMGIAGAMGGAAGAEGASSSKLSPLIVNAAAQDLGPTQRLNRERVDSATMTREDPSMLAGREERQGESVTTLRRQKDVPVESSLRIRARATAEQDKERQKRVIAISD